MWKRILFVWMMALPLSLFSQVRFGYVSYSAVLTAMPEYAEARKALQELKVKYDAEARRSEEEFQVKFAELLQGQRDFPANILQKRQKELLDLSEKGIAFRQEIQQLLASAEKEMLQNLYGKINEVLRVIGTEKGYGYILNTDGNSCPYINPALGEDVTAELKARLAVPALP
ncbi:MAG: OmpH family outer membrane protein [Paraprevotella sp.]|nr:OmpH family outer membrane protein [Paraprevotella sp.]